MAENLYRMENAALPSTSVTTGVATGTAAVVMLQLSTPSTRQVSLVEYGISFSGAPSAAAMSLRATSAAATATNMTAGVITPYSNPGAPTALCTSGTSNSCFFSGTSTAAPTATVSAVFDTQLLTANTFVKQFPLGREPAIPVSGFLQLCVLLGATLNATCYFVWRE